MTFNFHTSGFDTTSYQNKRLTLIQYVEEGGNFSRLPYNDGKGLVTIGLGFNLHDPAVRSLVLEQIKGSDSID
jgi:GH24 family phage-related lysozyme (muramidase)